MFTNEFYTQKHHGDYDIFELGDFSLESGGTLKSAKLAFAVHGNLNADKDNAILFTIMFSGSSKHMAHYIGPGLALDPEKYCIILPNQLGGGLSTSPHNAESSQAMAGFPRLTIGDDVNAQHRLLSEHFGIRSLRMVTGWSMGAQQTYEWAVRFPDVVQRAVPIAGTARCTPHDQLWTDVFSEALTSDPEWHQGDYPQADSCQQGLKRLAHVFALMGCCPDFYKSQDWQRLGFSSQQQFLTDFWEAWFLPMDPNALLVMANKWKYGDVSINDDGNLTRALQRITAKTHIIAFEKDMFIPVADCHDEHKMIPHSRLTILPSTMGHFAMLGCFEEDFANINKVFQQMLDW